MKWVLTIRGQITVLDRGGESVFVIRIFGEKYVFPYQRAFGLGTLYTRLCTVLNRRNARLTGSTLLIHSRTLYLCTRRPRPLRAPITIRSPEFGDIDSMSLTTLSKF